MTVVRLIALVGLGMLTLSACSRGGVPQLMNAAAQQSTPDEFSILPTGPLQTPTDFRSLPAPTPGGTNRVDPDPRGQAISALGGRNAAAHSNRVPAADAGLVRYAARAGSTDGIRATLAAEDEDFRRANRPRILERAFNTNTYHLAYQDQILDPQEELRRWRERGVRTPSAPPQGR